jgi:hypothetical protein
MMAHSRPPLKIAGSTIPGVAYSRRHIPLKITFENVGEEEIRLLQCFDPLPVFFSFSLVAEDGTPVSLPGAGKIDFFEGSIRYVALSPGQIFSLEVDIAEIIVFPEQLTPGNYSISVTYHNQYGENCFRGVLRSRPIHVHLAAD